ncbi:MAG: enoyl-CoA hydratase-related protein [Ilumatobacteraceae bacterium]
MEYRYLDVAADGPIATITLDNPQRRNALALDVMLEITEAFRTVGRTDARGIVLAANGPVFSAGHDFGNMAGVSLADAQELLTVCTDMMDVVQQVPQVVIAKVHALATAAGCQLVATCDLAIAAESAGFALPGGKGGLYCHTPLVAVARQIGRKRALEMSMTGDPIDAHTAADWGLINRAVPDDELDDAVADLMARATRGVPRRRHRASGRSTPRSTSTSRRPTPTRSRSWRRASSPHTAKRASPRSSRSASPTSPDRSPS